MDELKMPPKCARCDTTIKDKLLLICSTCSEIYHLSCTNVSEKRFYLMTHINKKNWACKSCCNKKSAAEKTPSPNIRQTPESLHKNITHRKKIIVNISTENSFSSLDADEDVYEDAATPLSDVNNSKRSLPDLRNFNEDIEMLKNTIKDLEQKLVSADNEIDILLSENFSLKKHIEERDNKITALTRICKSTNKQKPHESINKSIKKKQRLIFNEQSPGPISSPENHTDVNLEPSNSTPILLPQTKGYTNGDIDLCENMGSKTSDVHTANVADSDTIPTIENSTSSDTPNIIIIGDEQAMGLSKLVVRSRCNKWNDVYKTFAYIKPNASSSEALSFCNSLKTWVNKGDYVILCIGGNDSNPNKIIFDLCIALNNLHGINVLLLPVNYNRYLNEKMLNKNLKLLTNTFDNCTYLDISYLIDHRKYISIACQKINIHIDYDAYRAKFLNFQPKPYTFKLKLNTDSPSDSLKIPKKGTIPYYFPLLKQHNVEPTEKFFRP